MTTHSLLSPSWEVQAFLSGATQIRRPVKEHPIDVVTFLGKDKLPTGEYGLCFSEREISKHVRCPFGVPGDVIEVKEEWRWYGRDDGEITGGFEYRADGCSKAFRDFPDPGERWKEFCTAWSKGQVNIWRSASTMPAWAVRIRREVVEVRCEPVQSITEEDARAMGFEAWGLTEKEIADIQISDEIPDMKEFAVALGSVECTAVMQARMEWDSQFAKKGHPWSANPFCWAVTVKEAR